MKQLACGMFLALCAVLCLDALPAGKTILGLYKSSEGKTAKNNDINTYLSGIISDMGLRLDYWDVDAKIPREQDLKQVRAVITWFETDGMKDPEAYLKFLGSLTAAGRKLVIIGSMGAYVDSAGRTDVQPRLINAALSGLGITYLGRRTEGPEAISIAFSDSEICEYGTGQKVTPPADFDRFLPVDTELVTYLSVKDTDTDKAPSPVIASNADGGFALSGYIFRSADNRRLPQLNFRGFLTRALFPRPSSQRILLLADQTVEKTRRVSAYTQAVLKRAGVPFDLLTSDRFDVLCRHDLNGYDAVGLILNNDAGLRAELFTNYLYRGGGLVSLMAGGFNELKPLLAIGPQRAKDTWAKGFRIGQGFALGEELALEDDEYDWDCGACLPDSGAHVLGTDSAGKTPLVWTAGFNKGTVLVWNWNAFKGGEFQGLILESFLYVRPVGACVTPALGVLFIDDWPLPMYNNVAPPLRITTTEFYTTLWWPQLKELLAGFGVPPNAFLIFSYNDRTAPPFEDKEFFVAQGNAGVNAAREILKAGWELGLHGYNHVSLTREKTSYNPKVWPSTKNMALALEEAKRTWITLFGESTLPFAYVAPHNIISDEAVQALHEVFPSIKVVSTVREGGTDETPTAYGPSPTVPDIYYIPRVSSGYLCTPYVKQLIASAVMGPGIWTHFIHPDDIFDTYRSKGKNWQELKAGLEEMLGFVKKHYPWLRFVSIHRAYDILRALDQARITIRWQGNTLHIEAPAGVYIRIRANRYTPDDLDQARIVYRYEHMPVIIIQTTGPVHNITFK
jgi:hypothetical protein